MKRIIAALCMVLWCAVTVSAQQDLVAVPVLASPVTDLTGTLSNDQVQALSAKLLAFQQSKGAQVAVLLVPSTQPEAIEQYSIRVVEQWKLGRKKIDDGVLLLVATADRTLRIEVAYGLEGALSDLVSRRIIDEIIVPHFKQQDFYGGVAAGVDAILKVVSGEELPAPVRSSHQLQSDVSLIFLPLFLIIAVGSLIKAALGAKRAALFSGVGALIVSLFFLAIPFALLAGLVVALLVFSGIADGGTGGGGRGGGSWGGSSSYGGGGGSFGGGGASGRW